jgi:hypothetical protein
MKSEEIKKQTAAEKDKELFDKGYYLVNANCKITRITKRKLEIIARKKGLPLTMLIGLLIDQELQEIEPFDFNLDLPDDITEHAYADEAGKIVDYISRMPNGSSFETCYLIREELGITYKLDFLGGFKECLNHNSLYEYTPKDLFNYKHPKGTIHYKANEKVNGKFPTPTSRAKKMNTKEYKEYERLKKKFEVGGSNDG